MVVSVVLVVSANAFNIGADLGSMAEALALLVPVPFVLAVIAFAMGICALEFFVSYDRYSLVLRWLALSIFAYVLELAFIEVDWSQVASGLVPAFAFDGPHVEAIVAIFGTTISPYLFLWQAGEETEERKAGHVRKVDKVEIRAMRVDVVSGMTAGIIVMFGILVVSASTLGTVGGTVNSAEDAARALEPIAGRLASLVFTAGIVGTGLLAIPTLAGSAAYAVTEAFGWKEGLGRTLRQAPAFYGVIPGSLLLGIAMNFLGLEPIRAPYLSAILNGLAAPPLILLMLILSNSSAAGRQKGGVASNALVGIAFVVMSASAACTSSGCSDADTIAGCRSADTRSSTARAQRSEPRISGARRARWDGGTSARSPRMTPRRIERSSTSPSTHRGGRRARGSKPVPIASSCPPTEMLCAASSTTNP
jgi:Mn2+/Fe2+ NRAMP family transporter